MEPENAIWPPPEFRLFGACLMENPTTEEFQAIEKYLPLLKAFQTSLESRTPTEWDFTQDFDEMAQRDLAAWEQSPLALHFLNPTFHVADAQTIVTVDPTNATIKELHLTGLSSKHCFMFDEFSRRDRTDDCLHFYTEHIRHIHKDFIRKIQENMSAVVEVCFGEEVFQAVQRASHLERFPLWGNFKSVRLWLELEDSESTLKRFVIHAYHPSIFFRPGRLNKSGPSFDDAFGRPQELIIFMAVQLAGLSHRINIKSQLLGTRYYSKADIRLPTDQKLAVKENLLAGFNAFKIAFPEKFKRWELKASCNQSAKKIHSLIWNAVSLNHPFPCRHITPVYCQLRNKHVTSTTFIWT